MSLKLRYDPDRQVLASLGDPPNGLVCAAMRGGGELALYVDPSWEPPTVRAQGIEVRPRRVEPTDDLVLSPAEAVEACADRKAASALWLLSAGVCRSYLNEAEGDGDLESVALALELWGEVRAELVEHGFLTVEGE